jgi:hypothetical protein
MQEESSWPLPSYMQVHESVWNEKKKSGVLQLART